MKQQTAVIIGSGIGGLALANILAKAGYKVTVYERHGQAGGRAGTLEQDGFRFDTGPSWYLMPEIFEHYFDLIGEKRSDYYDITRLEPGYNVTFETGGSVAIDGNFEQDSKRFETLEAGSAEALKNYLANAKTVYDLAVKHFLYSNFNSIRSFVNRDVLRAGPRMVASAIRTLDGHVQRYFKSQPLQQIMEYPAVFLGASPFSAPAIYSLMSHLDFTQGVYYPAGGFYTIIESLVSIGKKLGITYVYDAPVAQISTNVHRATGIILEDGTKVAADIVISNADLHFTETKLLPEALQTYPERYWQKREAGPSALLMYLGVKGSLPNFEHHNLFFAEAWQRNFSDIFETHIWPETASMYVCVPSKTDATVAPKGHENMFVLVPGPPLTDDNQVDLEVLYERYIDQLVELTGVEDLRSRIVSKKLYGPQDFAADLNAWQGSALGMSHTLKQSAFFRPKTQSSKVKNLYYVGGNTMPGIGLPMCLISAELVYKRLIGDKSSGPLERLA